MYARVFLRDNILDFLSTPQTIIIFHPSRTTCHFNYLLMLMLQFVKHQQLLKSNLVFKKYLI